MNVQIHCDYCDKSLYNPIELTDQEGSGVKLWTMDNRFTHQAFDSSRHEFCDWVCVERWARGKALASA